MSDTVTAADLGISSGTFTELPRRTRTGGGGRKSPFLDCLRNELANPGTMVTINVERRPLTDNQGEVITDADGNPQLEHFDIAAKRVSAKIYRKDAFDFKPVIRTNAADCTIQVFHLTPEMESDSTQEDA